jgi:hypothetical protein
LEAQRVPSNGQGLSAVASAQWRPVASVTR